MMNLDSKYFDRIRTHRKKEQDAGPATPTCQWDGCEKAGVHRAPVGRNAEGSVFPVLLRAREGIRTRDTTTSQVCRTTRSPATEKEAITGHRPTWTVGVNKAARNSPLHSTLRSGTAGTHSQVKDPFGFVGQSRGAGARFQPQARKLKSLDAKAFDTLGLPENSSASEIKSRYKELVKKHHPDANGGDRGSEDRFRAVIQAYQLLKQSGFC